MDSYIVGLARFIALCLVLSTFFLPIGWAFLFARRVKKRFAEREHLLRELQEEMGITPIAGQFGDFRLVHRVENGLCGVYNNRRWTNFYVYLFFPYTGPGGQGAILPKKSLGWLERSGAKDELCQQYPELKECTVSLSTDWPVPVLFENASFRAVARDHRVVFGFYEGQMEWGRRQFTGDYHRLNTGFVSISAYLHDKAQWRTLILSAHEIMRHLMDRQVVDRTRTLDPCIFLSEDSFLQPD